MRWSNLPAMAMLVCWVSFGMPAPAGAWQTIPLTGASAGGGDVGVPLTLVASAEAVLPSSSTMVVWLVERQAGAEGGGQRDTALAYTLPRPPLPNMHGEHGAARSAADLGRAARIVPGELVPLRDATADSELPVQLSIVAQDSLPSGTLASAPFAALDDRLLLELREGRLAPGQEALITTRETPVVLLAIDNPIEIGEGIDAPLEARSGELTLLTTNATIRNAGARVATFAVAWIAADDAAPEQQVPAEITLGGDAELDEAWQRFGCHLNPGNPSCLTVGLAAACVSAPSAPGCSSDSDADTCRDIAEVRAGLDPFEPADCIGGREGQPLVNCLFPTGDLACDGSRDGNGSLDCHAVDENRGQDTDATDACGRELGETEIDCQHLERDPTCDGFGLQSR